jgi:hypothetical protein
MALLNRELVAAEARMSNENFEKHMEMRHPESLGYLSGLPLKDKMLMKCWRTFHGHLHRWRIDLEHEHSEE